MSAVIKEIKQRATDIMNSTVTGYITIVHGNDGSEALYCTDTPDYKKAMKMWRLSMAGFGYSDNGGNDWKIAITMDGRINADFITSGTMNANIIRTGVLKDANSNVVFDLENGTLSIKKGSINLGNGNFSVSTDGYLTSTSGQIGGFTIGTESLYSDDIELSKYRVAFKQYGAYVGEIRGIRLPTNDTNRGVVLNLGYGQAVIGMSIGTSWSNDGFDPIFLYFDRDVITGDVQGTAKTLYFARNTNFKGHKAYNIWIDPESGGASGGISGTLNFVQIRGVDSSGKPTAWSTGAKMEFKNGLLVGAQWNG